MNPCGVTASSCDYYHDAMSAGRKLRAEKLNTSDASPPSAKEMYFKKRGKKLTSVVIFVN